MSESDPPPSEVAADKLLDAIATRAVERGWTEAALALAAVDAGLSEAELALACPGGVNDLLDLLAGRAGKAAAQALADDAAKGMKIRQKVALGVMAYLDALEPFKASLRGAVASPFRAPAGVQAVWGAADEIWSGLGDASTDFNWYSKRLILSGVITSTGLCWLGSENREEVQAFLARRIDDVMRFEKAKAGWRDATKGFPNPLDLIGRRPGPAEDDPAGAPRSR
ncbi:COQ9 family protein [bacterium]|nr:COQ9 family protein [bacterium]